MQSRSLPLRVLQFLSLREAEFPVGGAAGRGNPALVAELVMAANRTRLADGCPVAGTEVLALQRGGPASTLHRTGWPCSKRGWLTARAGVWRELPLGPAPLGPAPAWPMWAMGRPRGRPAEAADESAEKRLHASCACAACGDCRQRPRDLLSTKERRGLGPMVTPYPVRTRRWHNRDPATGERGGITLLMLP